MAIDINNNLEVQDEPKFQSTSDSSASNDVVSPIHEQQPTPHGLSAEEQTDPNKISVTIADKSTPIIILFGPPSCGKTMTLVRMTRYLQSEGYTVQPIRTFRPTADTHYSDICKNFDGMINSSDAARSTNRISFMLVMVMKKGKPICQILEAPGEYYFNPDDPFKQFPTYIHSIITGDNRKIWSIFVEPDWNDLTPRMNYVTKIGKLKSQLNPTDKVLFVYNKVDTTQYVISPGNVKLNLIQKNIEDLYPNIFTFFENQNPITKFFTKYNCDLVPFQTGFYNESMTGLTYTEGPKPYAQALWNKWLKLING